MTDPGLNDRGLSDQARAILAHAAGLIAADHPQLWTDTALLAAAARKGDPSQAIEIRVNA